MELLRRVIRRIEKKDAASAGGFFLGMSGKGNKQ
jgi:hypothetical protein